MKKYSVYIPLITIVGCLILISKIDVGQELMFNVNYSNLTKEARTQVDCLADNVFFEAGVEPEDGKKAVALVTMNRTQDPRFPKDICSVVKQKTLTATGGRICQFSWFCESPKSKDSYAYKQSKLVALNVYANYEKIVDITQGALYYHATRISPGWKNLEKTVVIGQHVFYAQK